MVTTLIRKSVFFLFSLCICLVSTSLLPKTSQIDLIIEGLEEQEWPSDETKCLQDTLLILRNVKNHTLWASWIWNSNQFPVGTFYGSRYSLGNYDQCLKGPKGKSSNPVMLTQYCTADVKLTADKGIKTNEEANVYGNAEDFLSFKNTNGRILNLITWGICLPATCKPVSISKILKAIYLVNPITSIEPDITVDNCQTSGEKVIYSRAFSVFISITVLLIFTALLSTLYVEYIDKEINSTMKKIAYSFSLLRNWSEFTRISSNEIPVLHFAKSVHVVLNACAHSLMFTMIAGVGNGLDIDYLLSVKSNMFMNLVHHIDLAFVEIFFVISGLLVIKGLMEKSNNPIIVLIKRYIRLIGSFAFTVFYCIAVSKYTGDGPLWNKHIGREQKACEDNWIWSLLLLNNYVNSDGICRLAAWYLPCDYHLAVMGTGLFFIWQWNRKAGKMTTIAAAILAVLLPGVVTYWRRLPGIMFYDIGTMNEKWRTNQVYLHVYIPSHLRMGPYLLGMALGYILTKYKPNEYRGVISKKWCIIGFAVSGIIGFYVWASAGPWCLGEYNVWNSAVYAALNRNIWALSTCVGIAITEYGDLPSLRTIMAWPVFVITSRVSYGVYIVHTLIIERNLFTLRNPIYHDLIIEITNGFGLFTLSGAFAILLLLFVEMPLSNLTNLILDPKKKIIANVKRENNTNDHIAEMKNELKCL